MKLAGCIIKDDKGRVLLLHRRTDKYVHWEIPGGKVEPGEKPEQAAVREIKEELDVNVIIERKFAENDFEVDGETVHNFWYLAKIISGTPRAAEPQTFDDLRYFSTEEMAKIRGQLSASAQNYLNY